MDRDFLRRLERELTEKGKLIEAGWVGLRLAAIPEDAGKQQLESMREAFFAGAQHLFSSIMTIMDSDREPTEADYARMGHIQGELDNFIAEFAKRHKIPGPVTH